MIETGIKQPLRFYDSLDKQNFRREWANGTGLTEHNVLVNPNNTILPFQIRRSTSLNPVAVFDLYKLNNVTGEFEYETDLFTIIPLPDTDHLRVVQVGEVDNIIWNPRANFTDFLNCGFYYVTLSDGVSTWYSEVFKVYNFDASETIDLNVGTDAPGLEEKSVIGWTVGGNDYQIVINEKPI